MAECHPVGFQWVMEAKERGAKIIHVDPRFTRTRAVADLHVPIRAGTDIAFLGALVNYVLTDEQDFREYVVAYTNAAAIVGEDFRDTEDLDGLFSGCDPRAQVRPEQLAVRGCQRGCRRRATGPGSVRQRRAGPRGHQESVRGGTAAAASIPAQAATATRR